MNALCYWLGAHCAKLAVPFNPSSFWLPALFTSNSLNQFTLYAMKKKLNQSKWNGICDIWNNPGSRAVIFTMTLLPSESLYCLIKPEQSQLLSWKWVTHYIVITRSGSRPWSLKKSLRFGKICYMAVHRMYVCSMSVTHSIIRPGSGWLLQGLLG